MGNTQESQPAVTCTTYAGVTVTCTTSVHRTGNFLNNTFEFLGNNVIYGNSKYDVFKFINIWII